MVVSHKTKLIFIHIHKCAGSSIERALRQADPSIGDEYPGGARHIHANELRNVLETEVWNSYHKFAFVRNPWERLVSWHKMCMELGSNEFQAHVQKNYPDFSDFILSDCESLYRTRVNQLTYITDNNDNLLVDFVGRFENLDTDFTKLQLAVTLPHVNSSVHDDYRGYYTPQTRDIVAKRFAKDIEYFGYKFD